VPFGRMVLFARVDAAVSTWIAAICATGSRVFGGGPWYQLDEYKLVPGLLAVLTSALKYIRYKLKYQYKVQSVSCLNRNVRFSQCGHVLLQV
jgi:hypothetical protein